METAVPAVFLAPRFCRPPGGGPGMFEAWSLQLFEKRKACLIVDLTEFESADEAVSVSTFKSLF
jgi:hypothetical protein